VELGWREGKGCWEGRAPQSCIGTCTVDTSEQGASHNNELPEVTDLQREKFGQGQWCTPVIPDFHLTCYNHLAYSHNRVKFLPQNFSSSSMAQSSKFRGCNSVAECLPTVYKALGSAPHTKSSSSKCPLRHKHTFSCETPINSKAS
jgi:hypothetical protein